MEAIIALSIFAYLIVLVVMALQKDSFWDAFRLFAKGILYPFLVLLVLMVVCQIIVKK